MNGLSRYCDNSSGRVSGNCSIATRGKLLNMRVKLLSTCAKFISTRITNNTCVAHVFTVDPLSLGTGISPLISEVS